MRYHNDTNEIKLYHPATLFGSINLCDLVFIPLSVRVILWFMNFVLLVWMII